jgi:hypothetical protein
MAGELKASPATHASMRIRTFVELKKEIYFEISHVLFIDIVGYSKLLFRKAQANGRLKEFSPAMAWRWSLTRA